MKQIKKAGLPFFVVLLLGGIIGYILGCTKTQRDRESQARASQQETKSETSKKTAPNEENGDQPKNAKAPPTAKAVRDVYYPGTEELGPNDLRVVALGTGMPANRPKQAAACFLVELGNGDKFLFDCGYGSADRLSAMKIPMDYLDKVFMASHLEHASAEQMPFT